MKITLLVVSRQYHRNQSRKGLNYPPGIASRIPARTFATTSNLENGIVLAFDLP
jgi:hypothetical protein